MPVHIRKVQPDDVPFIARADALSLSYRDDDFEVDLARPWALTEAKVMQSIRQRSPMTRVYAVESQGEAKDDATGEAVAVNWVSGGFSYGIYDDFYGLDWLALHPDADAGAMLAEVAEFLRDKAKQGRKRPEVRLVLRDADEAGLRWLLPAWRAQGFRFELWRDYWPAEGGLPACDGWLGVYEVRRKSSVKTS